MGPVRNTGFASFIIVIVILTHLWIMFMAPGEILDEDFFIKKVFLRFKNICFLFFFSVASHL